MNRRCRKQICQNIDDIHMVEQQKQDECCHGSHEPCDVMQVAVEHHAKGTDVGEVFSMPRVVPMAHRKGLRVGKSYDIGNGWNFLDPQHRKMCRDEIEKQKPQTLVISPPCGPFSQLQRLCKDKGDTQEKQRKLTEARVLLGFAMELCRLQHQAGRIFIFEHPLGADSWKEEDVEQVRQLSGVKSVHVDQCMYGLCDPLNKRRYKKATRLLTNSQHGDMLMRRCDGNHDHQVIEGQVKVGGRWINRSRMAQVYPRKMVEAIVRLARLERNKAEHDVLASEKLEDNKDLENNIRRCHVNLGHPSKERFIHMLKSANASHAAIEAAKKLNCSVCSAKRLQNAHQVAKTKRAEAFNQRLNMDVFDLLIFQQKVLKMLNIYCEGTGYQLCVPLWGGGNCRSHS